MSFEVKTPLFEGPFDLLLFFIRRDELDIHDIPIAKITKDFLDYIHQLEQLNMEVASEFILVASTLMRIKAKMLLPRVEVDEAGNEIDPREELVKHLLEYKKYKSVVGELEAWEDTMLQKEPRGNLKQEIKQLSAINNLEIELQQVDLYKLLNVFQRVMNRYEVEQNRPIHRVVPYPYKVEDQKVVILEKLQQVGKVSFADIIQKDANRVAVIFNFLAILELLASGDLTVSLGMGFNNFWIEKRDAERVEE